MKTIIDIQIVYDGMLEMPEASELFDRIKGQLGTIPVKDFHFEVTHDDEVQAWGQLKNPR